MDGIAFSDGWAGASEMDGAMVFFSSLSWVTSISEDSSPDGADSEVPISSDSTTLKDGADAGAGEGAARAAASCTGAVSGSTGASTEGEESGFGEGSGDAGGEISAGADGAGASAAGEACRE